MAVLPVSDPFTRSHAFVTINPALRPLVGGRHEIQSNPSVAARGERGRRRRTASDGRHGWMVEPRNRVATLHRVNGGSTERRAGVDPACAGPGDSHAARLSAERCRTVRGWRVGTFVCASARHRRVSRNDAAWRVSSGSGLETFWSPCVIPSEPDRAGRATCTCTPRRHTRC